MDAIRQYLPDDLTVAPCATGLHLVALFTERLKARMSDVEAARLLKQGGLHVQPLSQNHLETPIYAGLVLGYGRLKPTDAPRLIAKMAQILGVEPSAAKK
jgi:GntR family transcriptional regulator/MocR family aminotransferase